jgi:competence protein ComGC
MSHKTHMFIVIFLFLSILLAILVPYIIETESKKREKNRNIMF